MRVAEGHKLSLEQTWNQDTGVPGLEPRLSLPGHPLSSGAFQYSLCGTLDGLERAEGCTGPVRQSKAATTPRPEVTSLLPHSLPILRPSPHHVLRGFPRGHKSYFESWGRTLQKQDCQGYVKSREKGVCAAFVWPLPGFSPCPPVPRTLVPGTPEMRVIHAGLVVGNSDEGRGWAPVLDELVQHLLVVDGEVVHVLWGGETDCGEEPWLLPSSGTQGSPRSQTSACPHPQPRTPTLAGRGQPWPTLPRLQAHSLVQKQLYVPTRPMTTLLARVQVNGGTAGNGHFTCRGISPRPDRAPQLRPTRPGASPAPGQPVGPF